MTKQPNQPQLNWTGDGQMRTASFGTCEFNVYKHHECDYTLYRKDQHPQDWHLSFDADGWDQALDYAEYAIATGEFEQAGDRIKAEVAA